MPSINTIQVQPQSFTRPKYRADIDGLRAIAILSVLFFHAFPHAIPGGFVGVDIFFVISGYLISGIIFRGLQHETFSFFDFYARRVRRIFPAVAVAILGAFVLGFFFLTSYEQEELIRESPYAAFFVENLRLYLQTGGYWDVGTELKPFMHFWSLGVEEQYYIFYPLICFVLWKFSKNTFLLSLIVMFVVSFALCLYDTANEPIRAFYSLHSRFWELLIGGGLAYIELQWPQFKQTLPFVLRNDHLISISGFILLIVALIFFKEGIGFPGWKALFPTLGALLVIWAGEKAWINKVVLSNKAVVFIGLISYPLYLWHWIFICIFRNNLAGELPTGRLIWIAIGLSFLMAYLTYTLIERPMRTRKATWKLVVSLSLVLLISTIGVKTAIKQSDMLQSLLYSNSSALVAKTIRQIPHTEQKDSSCELKFGKDHVVCRATAERPTTLIYGDSHNHLMWKYLHQQNNLPPFYIVGSDAAVVFDEVDELYDNKLSRRDGYIWETLRKSPEIKTVVLRGYWVSYYTRDLRSRKYPDLRGKELIELLWKDLFSEFHDMGIKVFLVLDNIDVNFDPIKKCLSVHRVSLAPKQGDDCLVPYDQIDKLEYDTRAFLTNEAKKWDNVTVIDSWQALCNEKGCYLAKGEVPYYQDNDHLSPYGNELLWPLIKKAISHN